MLRGRAAGRHRLPHPPTGRARAGLPCPSLPEDCERMTASEQGQTPPAVAGREVESEERREGGRAGERRPVTCMPT